MLSAFSTSAVLNMISVPTFTFSYGEKRTPCDHTNVASVVKSWFLIAFKTASIEPVRSSVHDVIQQEVELVREHVSTGALPHPAKSIIHAKGSKIPK